MCEVQSSNFSTKSSSSKCMLLIWSIQLLFEIFAAQERAPSIATNAGLRAGARKASVSAGRYLAAVKLGPNSVYASSHTEILFQLKRHNIFHYQHH